MSSRLALPLPLAFALLAAAACDDELPAFALPPPADASVSDAAQDEDAGSTGDELPPDAASSR